jgi:phosphate transport system substrate-binding protein
MLKQVLAAAATAAVLLSGAQAQTINGAGATFPYPIYAKWAEAYKAKTGVAMNYQSIGSGGGIKQIQEKTVDFGATDAPMSGADLDKFGLVQFPMVMGGVVPVVNVKGIEPGQLKLTGALLADIYLGKITKWNDAKLAALNPDLKLPNLAISPVNRSDGSGTTFVFTGYLSKVSKDWETKVGTNTAVEWPAPAGQGGKGNEGVAAIASRTEGAIGYVEYAYAKQNKLSYAVLQNKEGKFVTPNAVSFQAAAANADWSSAPGFGVVLTNQAGGDTWPITSATFILMYKNQAKPEIGKAALAFFDWSYKNGGDLAAGLDYVPMPAKAIDLVQQAWKSIVGPDGKTLWTGSAGM